MKLIRKKIEIKNVIKVELKPTKYESTPNFENSTTKKPQSKEKIDTKNRIIEMEL